ncbi:MAG: AraC family transcriptional regulator [Arenicellales bacterium]
MTAEFETHTVPSNIALAIARVAQAHDLDGEALMRDAGIQVEAAHQQEARISAAQHQTLWRLLIERTGKPCIALDIGQSISPGAIHGLGLGWLVSDTLKSALERLVRFQRLVSTNVDIELLETEKHYDLIYRAKTQSKSFQTASADALLIFTMRLCRLALSESINAQKIELGHTDNQCVDAYGAFFRCPVAANSARYAIVFDKDVLEQHLPDANPLLARINDESVTEYLARYELADFVTQVRKIVIEKLTQQKPDQATIARELHVSVRQLQRELQERGFTFKALLEEIRRELAISYLSEGVKSIGEITYLLGYTEPANFGRSFKKWTGQTPGEFRASR